MENWQLDGLNKNDVIALIERVRAFLQTEKIGSGVWAVEPSGFVLHVQTQRQDLSSALYGLYKFDEVQRVSLATDPHSKVYLVQVSLNDEWFKERHDARKRGKHPEAEGGTLA